MAGWCAALLIPWLRRPSTALIALALPAVYFWIRAELGLRARTEEGPRYRNSAAVLGFVVLGLYALRPVFQMVLFPETRIHTDHYHHNAVFVMALGLLLMRLHALGGTEWLAFYGGLALMGGSYFALTAWPGLSPFEHPMPAAWCAVALAHFWTAASDRRSPLRAMLQGLAGLDDARWLRLRVSWGRCVLAASQFAVLLGLLDYRVRHLHGRALAAGRGQRARPSGRAHEPLLVPGRRPGRDRARAARGLLRAELARPPRRALGAARDLGRAAARAPRARDLRRRGRDRRRPAGDVRDGPRGLSPAVVGGGTVGGRFAAALAALTPRETSEPSSPDESFAAALLLAAPVWLVYFSQADIEGQGLEGALRVWPILAATATLFLVGVAGRLYQPVWEANRPLPDQPRLFHQVLALLGHHGGTLHTATAWVGHGRGRPPAARPLRPALRASRHRAPVRPLRRPGRGLVPRGAIGARPAGLHDRGAVPARPLRRRPAAAPPHHHALVVRIRRVGEPGRVLRAGRGQAGLRRPAARAAPARHDHAPGLARHRDHLDARPSPGHGRRAGRGRPAQPDVRVRRPRSARLALQPGRPRRFRRLPAHRSSGASCTCASCTRT